ncbi:cell division cycle protein 27 homolog [Scaptodrosophila lebanonensis]|uniref:Cell division cycle protein 27 homolog n=1 Tax=Drosophila lebanonensis TaxID=7225 RepID=A0A6J2UAH5_DROLE|nr:cell division cycle protein 27 homolog [Scaptodrosophila lebanonensis]
MMVQEPVQAAIWHCLNHYDHKDAIFLAERLCCEVENDETIFLLATSYYRSNLVHQAYWLLKEKPRRSPQCRYLLAKCAYELKKYADAECALISTGFADNKNFDELQKEFGELACFAYELIAQICVRTERNKLAASALRRALKLNPFMWHAFANLCLLGQDTDTSTIFQIHSTDVFNTCQGNANPNSMVLFGGAHLLSDQQPQNQQQLQQQTALETLLLSNLSNNTNYILSTPVDQQPANQQQQQQQQQNNNSGLANLQNLITPNNNNNNNNNLNSSITMLRGGGGIALQQNSQNTNMLMLEDTPMAYAHDTSGVTALPAGQQQQQQLYDGAGTPFRKQFKYLSNLSPLTPSFGIMPLTSPCAAGNGDGSFIANFNTSAVQSNLNISYSPLPQMLVEVNQEPKIMGKKLKTHVGGIINRKDTSSNNKPAVFTQTGNITPRTPNNVGNPNTGVAPNPNAAVRRSSRLFSNSAYSVKENNKSPNITNNKFVQPRSPPRKTKTRMPKICLNNELIEEKSHHLTDKLSEKQARKEKVETITSATGNNNNNNRNAAEDAKVLLNNSLNNAQTMAHQLLGMKKQSADGLMSLLRDLGDGYKLLSTFQCKAAIKQFESTIPKHHLCSSWVQSLIAMSNYEMRDYEAAVTIFKRIHEAEPCRLDYMEIYSTSLWHLQKEVELSALAQDLINQDKSNPVTWCVAGNCFSLHKEHETAIKFFKRAVQVDADFVYSYTLLGHELALTEEFDKAMDYFRAAVVRDPRHYNAWFGIGTIYSKQEKYELAELHYVKALKINPQNSVILVHIGAMQFFMQKKDLALQTLNTAATLDPKNPLARFHRGSIYFSLGKYQEALRELEELKEIVPKESVVFYLIGKIHKTLGNMDLALMHFSWATDLDPKGANNQMKDAFDSMAHPSCCPASDTALDVDFEPTSERSDDSTQAQQDVSYDSDY